MKKVKAWLVTWESIKPEWKVTHPVIAIFSSRKSMKFVSEFVQQYHLMSSLTGRGVVGCMNHTGKILHKVRCAPLVKDRFSVWRSDLNNLGRITCGKDPYICARRVTELEITDIDDVQIFKWTESPGEVRELQIKLGTLIDRCR